MTVFSGSLGRGHVSYEQECARKWLSCHVKACHTPCRLQEITILADMTDREQDNCNQVAETPGHLLAQRCCKSEPGAYRRIGRMSHGWGKYTQRSKHLVSSHHSMLELITWLELCSLHSLVVLNLLPSAKSQGLSHMHTKLCQLQLYLKAILGLSFPQVRHFLGTGSSQKSCCPDYHNSCLVYLLRNPLASNFAAALAKNLWQCTCKEPLSRPGCKGDPASQHNCSFKFELRTENRVPLAEWDRQEDAWQVIYCMLVRCPLKFPNRRGIRDFCLQTLSGTPQNSSLLAALKQTESAETFCQVQLAVIDQFDAFSFAQQTSDTDSLLLSLQCSVDPHTYETREILSLSLSSIIKILWVLQADRDAFAAGRFEWASRGEPPWSHYWCQHYCPSWIAEKGYGPNQDWE